MFLPISAGLPPWADHPGGVVDKDIEIAAAEGTDGIVDRGESLVLTVFAQIERGFFSHRLGIFRRRAVGAVRHGRGDNQAYQ